MDNLLTVFLLISGGVCGLVAGLILGSSFERAKQRGYNGVKYARKPPHKVFNSGGCHIDLDEADNYDHQL